MRWFYLNTHSRGAYEFGWLGKNDKIYKKEGRTGSLIADISSKIKVSDLQSCAGICAVSGPGSFSAIRGGVLVANLLARILKKPLYGIDASSAEDLTKVAADLAANNIQSTTYLEPIYDQEPNITTKPKPKTEH